MFFKKINSEAKSAEQILIQGETKLANEIINNKTGLRIGLPKRPIHISTFVFITILILGFIFSITSVSAITKTWDGGGVDNNWSTCANWNFDSCPAAGDTVVFDATSIKDVTVDAGFAGTIAIVNINAGYSGTITLARTFTVNGAFTQSAGIFNASNQTLSITSTFTLNSGGNFTASSGNTTFLGSININSASTFSANGGNIIFAGTTSSITYTCGNKLFNTVAISRTATSNTAITVNADCNFPVGNNPTIALNTASTNTFTLNGTLTGSGTITFNPFSNLVLNSTSALSGFNGFVANTITSITGATYDFSGYSTFNLTGAGNLTLNAGTNLTFPSPTGTGINMGALTVSTGATLTSSPGSINVFGSLSISSTSTFNHNNGIINFTGTAGSNYSCGNKTFNQINFVKSALGNISLTINADCNFPLGNNPTINTNVSNTGFLNLLGTLSGTGTLTFHTYTQPSFSSTTVLNGFNGLVASGIPGITGMVADFSSYTTFNLTGNISMALSSGANVILPSPTGTGINISTLTVNTGNSFTASPGLMTITGSFTISPTATFNANGGSIIFGGTTGGTLACGNTVFNSVQINKSTNGSTNNSVTINSDCNLPIGNNPTVSIGSNISAINYLYLYGTLSGSGTLTLSAASNRNNFYSTSQLSGFSGFVAPGIASVNNKNLDFSSYSPFNLTGNTALTLTSGSTLKLPQGTGNGINMGDIILNTGSTFVATTGDITASELTVNTGSNFTAPSGTLTLGGTITISSTATFNANNGTIAMIGTVSSRTLACGNAVFNNFSIYITGDRKTVTINNDCNLPLGNNPTVLISDNGFNGRSTLAIYGSISGTGTFTAGGLTDMDFRAGSTFTGFSGISAPNLTVSGGNINFSAYSAFSITNSITVNSGSIIMPNNSTANAVYISGGTYTGGTGLNTYVDIFYIDGGTFNANSGTTSVGGAFTISGTAVFNANSGTLNFTGAAASLICNNATFNNISFAGQTAQKTISSSCNFPLGNNPTIPSSISLSGSLSGTGKLTHTAGTLTINTGATISGFNELDGTTNSLTIAGATVDFSSYLSAKVGSIFTISSGTFSAPSTNFYVGGNFAHTGGTFNHSNGTVILNGNSQTITGTTTFNNFTKELTSATTYVLTFPSTLTQTILGSTRLIGYSTTNRLQLRSSSTATQWNIDPQGSREFLYVDVRDGNNINETSVNLSGSGSLNSGNNTNFGFTNTNPDSPINLGPANVVSGNAISNYTPTFSFRITDAQNPLDTLSYQIQISELSDFSINVVDYTSALGTQGNKSFVVGQATGTGTYTTGAPGQTLPVGNYYWKVRNIDNNVASSNYTIANSGNIAFSISNAPYNPSTLGPSEVTSNGYSSNKQPQFTFSISDPDLSDSVSYKIEISTQSNFSALIVDYTSALQAQGAATFVVGQDPGSGLYSAGSLGQMLSSGSYYWRVKTIDSNTLSSGYSVANSGEVGFNISEVPNDPVNLGPLNLVDGSAVTEQQPTFNFDITDPDIGDSIKYQIQIDDSSNFASPIVNYTSSLQAQGSTSYSVTTPLDIGSYYWRIRAIDNHNLSSNYVVANTGSIAFVIGGIPHDPSNIGPASVINNSLSTNHQPEFTFNLSDPDLSDQVRYKFQLDDSSGFDSLLIDYDSSLQSQGSFSFTVGQVTGTGSYLVGNVGQSLISNRYFWRIKTIDTNNLESAFVSEDFRITTPPDLPTNLGPSNVIDGSLSTNTRPTLNFTLSDDDIADRVRYNLQVSISSDFSTTIVNYTNPTLSNQGDKSYTIGSNLPSGDYYWRVRAIDEEGAQSDYEVANNGLISFRITAPPNNPAYSGTTSLINGSSTNNTQPIIIFNLSDADEFDTIKYQIQIDNSSTFNTPIIDYVSELLTQGTKSFMVGQLQGSGVYNNGYEGQELDSDSYYWRIIATDSNDISSSFVTYNTNSPAFIVSNLPSIPTNLGPLNLTDGSISTNTLPTFQFDISDPDLDDTVKYNIQIDNNNDYSSPLVNYTSTLQSQGSMAYSVSTPLTNGNYYWRVRSIDVNGLMSGYTSANSGEIAFTVGGLPNIPSSLGPVNLVGGQYILEKTPTFTFDLSDSDVGELVKYNIQISTNSNFSNIILDYISDYLEQGSNSFTIGQAINNGTYNIGTVGQELTTGGYYWRVKVIDLTNISSAFQVARGGAIAFNVTSIPNVPASLGPNDLIEGNLITNNQPSFTFSLSDSEAFEEVKFQIQVDDNSNFTSLNLDYVSGLLPQGVNTFTLGQSANGGIYTLGSQGQTLSSGSYYWRVRTIDVGGFNSEYTLANSGQIGFSLNAAPNSPFDLGPLILKDGTTRIETQPEFIFNISDPDFSEQLKYRIQVSSDSDYNTLLIDYLSDFQIQDIKQFRIGQPAYNGTYFIGSEDQELLSGRYYWRVQSIDSNNTESSYATASSTFAFGVTLKPEIPTELGPFNTTDGSSSVNTAPLFNFAINDPDLADTVRFQFQLADNSSFTSIVIDYQSNLQAQGSKSFQVGQSRGLGTYINGFSGQTLNAGDYYWRVRAIDVGGVTSEYTPAAGGNIAFTVISSNSPPNIPVNLGPTNLVNGSITTLTKPSFTFDISDPDTTDQVKYLIQIDNNSDFSSPLIDFISLLNNSGNFTYTTGESTNGGVYNIGLRDVALVDGTYYWRVKAIDEHGAASDYAIAPQQNGAFVVKTEQESGEQPPVIDDNDSNPPTGSTPPPTSETTPSYPISGEGQIIEDNPLINIVSNVVNRISKIEINESFSNLSIIGALLLINLILNPRILLYAIPYLFKSRSKNNGGVVYDSESNKPIPFATVRLLDMNHNFIKQDITRFKGEYGFLVDRGNYIIEVKHSDYITKEVAINIYQDGIVAQDIPLDRKVRFISNLRHGLKKYLGILNKMLFSLGLLFSFISIVNAPTFLNVLVGAFFIIQVGLILRSIFWGKNWGFIYDQQYQKGVPNLRLKLFSQDKKTLLDVLTTDDKGRLLVQHPAGEYYLFLNSDIYQLESGDKMARIIVAKNGNTPFRIPVRKL